MEIKEDFFFSQLKRLTGSTADTYLEYIQRNLPEGVAMKVTKVCSEYNVSSTSVIRTYDLAIIGTVRGSGSVVMAPSVPVQLPSVETCEIYWRQLTGVAVH